MEIIKQEKEKYYTYYLQQDGKELRILFGGNLDLYWSFTNTERNSNFKEHTTEPFIDTFTITKENYYIYSLFEELINDIKEAKVYTPIQEHENPYLDYTDKSDCDRWNKQLKTTDRYKMLCDGTNIVWHSDDEEYSVADSVKISKKDEDIILEFTRPPLTNDKFSLRLRNNCCIRFRNSGSRYDPFNIIFMNMYNKLQEYNPEYHQVHFEEIFYSKKLKK